MNSEASPSSRTATGRSLLVLPLLAIVGVGLTWNLWPWSFTLFNGLLGRGEFPALEERTLGEAGRLALAGGDAPAAIAHLEASLALDRTGPYRVALAEAHLRRNDAAAAKQVLNDHLRLYPDDARAAILADDIAQQQSVPIGDRRAALAPVQAALYQRLQEQPPPSGEGPRSRFTEKQAQTHRNVKGALESLQLRIRDLDSSSDSP